MIQVAIFASGGGSNAQVLTEYFKDHRQIKIAAFFTNKPSSGVIHLGKKYQIPCFIFNKEEFNNDKFMIKLFTKYAIDFIALAGFLWLIPPFFLQRFDRKIVNIHPSLLPKFGGKGMYGMKVHSAVSDSGLDHTGCTIHLVNEAYDDGDILLQKSVQIKPKSSPDTIAKAVLKLEHTYYAPTIENYLQKIFIEYQPNNILK
ncbi:MAG: phosphoribosylglycinamide formyltransferase [Saprospiraceae bacterium]